MANGGVVYLVGTGPGEPNLITVKGMALVREADALVGDAVNHARLLQEARPEAEIHDIGSRTRRNKIAQPEINRLLVDLARQNKTVVRLWAGDPFVFGRAAQEMIQLRRAGIRVEPVPGLTSALAGPVYAGVPVTHWDYSTNFAVVTGRASKNPAVQTDWSALAAVQTLVILMPLENLPQIVESLLAAGRAADTPAVILQQATLPQQKQVSATLGTLVEVVEKEAIEPPTIVIVGQVATLADQLAWFRPDQNLPLAGQRVLVTRPAHQAADFLVSLRTLGAEPISFPTIEIRPVGETQALDEAIRQIGAWTNGQLSPSGPSLASPPYDWLVLTSANGVAAFWDRLQANGLDSRSLASVRVAAIGPATAGALNRRSIRPNLVPELYTAEGVLAAFGELGSVEGQRFLLARSDLARPTLAEGLAQQGAVVDEIPTYRTVPVESGPFPPAADIVTFTSSSTVQGYVNCLGGRLPAAALQNSRVVCIGPITAATAKELGLPVYATARKYTIEGMLETLEEIQL